MQNHLHPPKNGLFVFPVCPQVQEAGIAALESSRCRHPLPIAEFAPSRQERNAALCSDSDPYPGITRVLRFAVGLLPLLGD